MAATTSIQRKVKADVSTTIENVYTVAASTLAAVNWISLKNNSKRKTIIGNVRLYPLGVAGNEIVLAKDVVIPPKWVYRYKGYRSLLATDELWVQSDTAATMDCVITGLEHSAAESKIIQAHKKDVTTAFSTLYTAPFTNATVNDLSLINKGSSPVLIDVVKHPLGVGGASTIEIATDYLLNPRELFEHTGAIGMLSTDTVAVKASVASAVDAILSGVKG